MTTAVEANFDLRTVIRKRLRDSREVDPWELAKRLVRDLPNAVIDDLVVSALAHSIREEIRYARNAEHVSGGESRWVRHHINVEHLGDRIALNGDGWKWLGECTADDLEQYAQQQLTRAAGLQASAEAARDLAKQMRTTGKATVQELFAAQKKAAA